MTIQLLPINTAPKNKYILLWGDSGYTTTPMRCEVGHWNKDKERWDTHSDDDFCDGGDPPTHWSPLEVDNTARYSQNTDPPVDGYAVARWPEFIALAKRLGIVLDNNWKGVLIDIHCDRLVTITQEYNASDINTPEQRKAKTPLGDGVIDTTNIHNEEYRTYKPK